MNRTISIGEPSALPHSRRRAMPAARIDLAIVVVLGLSAFLLAKWYLPIYRSASGASPFFYQDQFGPAVMQACGRGFINADPTTAPALQAFLEQRVDHLRCEELPASLRLDLPNPFQRISRYLMTAVAIVWRVTGIRWQSIDLLLASFFSVTVLAAYAALRFICGRVPSLFVATFWATSTWHLHNLPYLRDYSKAPFFVLMLVAMAVAFVERRPSRLIALGLAFGVVQGLGYGMRADVVLNFIPFFVVLFAGTPEGLFGGIKAKTACAAAAVLTFGGIAYPIFLTYRETGVLWHVMLLGLTSPYDVNLKLAVPWPPYNFGYMYHDGYIETVVRSYWARVHPDGSQFMLGSHAYGVACHEYYARLAKTFPGDIVTRLAASATSVFNLPFSQVYGDVPRGISSPALAWLSGRRSSLMQAFEGTGVLAVAAFLVLIGMERLRYACVAFVLLLACAAYPSLQYQYRHVFQLEFVVLALLVWSVSIGSRVVRRITSEEPTRHVITSGLRSMATVGILFAAVCSTLVIARAVQVPKARALLASYTDAPLVPVATTRRPLPGEQVRLAADVFGAPPSGDGVQTAMLVAGLTTDRCQARVPIVATFRYDQSDPAFALDFSRQAMVPFDAHSSTFARIFLPVYSIHHAGTVMSRFVGVDIPTSHAPCFQLWRVQDVTQLPPLLLPATLMADWAGERLYQRLSMDRALPPRVWRTIAGWWPRLSQLG